MSRSLSPDAPLLAQPLEGHPLLEAAPGNIVLFHPHVPSSAASRVTDVLRGRWIGQGPLVDEFEGRFAERLGCAGRAVAVGSGTDALHIAYILAGIQPGDEVIAPVFTCVATNMPLLYQRARIRFADVQPQTLNIDPGHVRALVSDQTRAIVCTHYAGLPCDMDELAAVARERGIPLIEDAAQALGAVYRGRPIGTTADFTAFSFQAVKHITTGDGGMLMARDASAVGRGRLLRWFGIDRPKKHEGRWENDIEETGYKYQMTDVAAAMGLAGLDELDSILQHRRGLLSAYSLGLRDTPGVALIAANPEDRQHAAWACTILVDGRDGLERKLLEHCIEARQVHYRNDRYSIFRRFRGDCPNMDQLESRYLLLPLHTKMSVDDVELVCSIIRSGW
jgi:perosamine synthetase